ncbi:isocyanide synthase family protein [Pseudoalteromonas sp. S16_S37]|uniref:isocyanide synthase family protein n=1 Tax=Pseudoalteromonas sp. S16_S37 TaxID=2720228 RepID=UPI001680B673|nr:isocyanide synthase family protein [Pseudoalteromonas sp. S16_S37]MBD1581443.1 L-tyrosine/L-tryptophan isonitrile synthase family protein [Pseudoalteromonas sp. S16_S37]
MDHVTKLAKNIVSLIFARRKLVASEAPLLHEFEHFDEQETAHHVAIVKNLIEQQQPITMILPAYPGKSPNRDKTLSYLPDLAEMHSIDLLNELCEEISTVYSFGAKLIICSDGYVFSDLVRIPDENVQAYTDQVIAYYSEHYPQHFDFFDIKDAFTQLKCLSSMREELMIMYGESLITLTACAKTDPATKSMYTGITRFLFEDYCGLSEFAQSSKTQIQKLAKQTSLRVIQRSNAWSALLEDKFPNAVRLSIHPQFRVSKKIGIQLGRAEDSWRTPWHSVAVRVDGEVQLKRRSLVDENRYRLIFNQGKPCHYQPQFVQELGEQRA